MVRTGMLVRLLAVAILAHLLAPVSLADTTESFWNANTGDWSLATNWTPNTVPSSTVSAVFNTAFINHPTLSPASPAQGLWVTGRNPTGVRGLPLTDPATAKTLTIPGTATLDSLTNAGILLDGAGNNG